MNTLYHKQATSLLENSDVVNLLSEFGTVVVVGSYAFDLMTEPDIDLVVITDTPKESSEKALEKISKLHLFQKLEYGDFQTFPRQNRPPYFILNMRTPHEGESWEIETWFLPEAREKIAFTEIMQSITQEQRGEILKLKLERKRSGTSKQKLSSYEIYKKVTGF